MLVLSEAEGVLVSVPVGLALLSTGCITALLAARMGLSLWAKRQRKKLLKVMDKVMNSFSSVQSTSPIIEPSIELPDLSEATEPHTHEIKHNNKVRS